MRVISLFGLTTLLLFAPPQQAALGDTEIQEWSCGVLAPDADGKFVVTNLQSLHVLHQTLENAQFVLPADAPKGVVSIMCGRSSIVPAPDDYRVLLFGVALSIVQGERVAVLEAWKGQLRLRALKGALTPEEAELVQKRLDEMQLLFDAGEPNKSLERTREG